MTHSFYDAESISHYFDEYGLREWDRLVATPLDEISLHLHTHYLGQFVPSGSCVLEIGAGAGRFTQVLAELGARVVVADISSGQLELNRRQAQLLGFESAIEDWRQVDICVMDDFETGTFDRVVAYGGPLSYVLDRRDLALAECMRVLKPQGLLLFSVMSLWGAVHRHLDGVMEEPPENNLKIVATGDLTPATSPGRQSNFMHLFRAGELKRWLLDSGLEILALSAAGCLSVGRMDFLPQVRADEARWQELLGMELETSAEDESLNLGTFILGVVRNLVSASASRNQVSHPIF
jgi:SAM-dependent methyltransferase